MTESIGIDGFIKLTMQIIDKLPITLAVMALSLFFGLLLGLAIAIVRLHPGRVSYAIATFYISFMRCTPALVQLFLIFYGLPQLLLVIDIDINDWDVAVFAVITFTLHTAAFLSEVIRSAYLAVGNSQLEAAYSVGMSYFQALRRIILPQAIRIALPNLGNNTIILLKETSLAFTIGLIDIMGQARIIIGNNHGMNMFEVYVVISLVYWSICILIERSVAYLETIFSKGHVGFSDKRVN